RAFEAAARLGSITKAAEELSVSPGAVSHQIRILEADLGIELLARNGRSVVPTAEARAGLEPLRLAFENLASAVTAIRQAGQRASLTVSAAPSFAAAWLVPRLDRFWARAPEIDVRIDTKWTLS